jgi:centractin
MADTLHNAPIVLDNGSGTIRAGFAGEDIPKCTFPSFVGRPKHLRVLAGALEGDVFIGDRAQELRGLLKIRYPLEHGIVTDWADMERIWEYVYGEGLKTLSEEVSPPFASYGASGTCRREDSLGIPLRCCEPICSLADQVYSIQYC